MIPSCDISEVTESLGRQAEAVCRHYLSSGHREGRYWLVGDVRNTPGRSTYVRLTGPKTGPGAAGKWTDAATGEHGDLLDMIREACALPRFVDVIAEARRFLSLPPSEPMQGAPGSKHSTGKSRADAGARLFNISIPIAGTIVEAYLRTRGITNLRDVASLRFQPRCYYRHGPGRPTETRPAMIAAVTDLADKITGAHRTWLQPDGSEKAAVPSPRRAMGNLLGNAVRFGRAGPVMAAGEGIETTLSFREALPGMPTLAGLSAAHLAAIAFPANLRRLYILADYDPAGAGAATTLVDRAQAAAIDTIPIFPHDNDLNADLCTMGLAQLRNFLLPQVAQEDWASFS